MPQNARMKKLDVIRHFGSVSATARALGFSRQAVQRWDKTIPRITALAIEALTDGALRADRPVPRKKKTPRQDSGR